MTDDALRQALASLDRAFADVPRIGTVDGCLACYSPGDLELLGGDPAVVPDDLVGSFARETLDHWSEEQYGAIWRSLAPRIIRLVITRGLICNSELRGLGDPLSRFPSWPEHQRTAVLDALKAALTAAVIERSGSEVMELVGGFSHVGQDMAPWFEHLNALPSPSHDAGIVRLACHWAAAVTWGDEPDLWWWPEDPDSAVRDWLRSPALRARLRRFADANPRCKTVSDAFIGIDAIDGDQALWLGFGYSYGRREIGGMHELVTF